MIVYVVVLTWNGWEDTEGCLRSLAPIARDGVRVLIVDNGSEDGTPEKVRRGFPGVEVIENGRNLGFPAGNNVGIRYALGGGADHVIILNNDTVVDKGFVSALLEVSRRHPDAGFYSSKIYFHEPPDVIWFAGATFSALTGRSRHVGYGERDDGRYDSVREIDRPCGCAMMASRRLLEDVGPMDERLFLYGEEIDWALRARKKGFRTLFVPGSRVWHKVSATAGGPSTGNYLYYCVRNLLAVLDAHARMGPPPVNFLRNVAVVATFVASLFTMKVDKVNGFRNIWRGVRDYRRGVFGPA